VCLRHGYLKGEQFSCPNCGEETEVYSRIVGYYRPVQNWNLGKKSEYHNRKLYKKGITPAAAPPHPVATQKEMVCEPAIPAS